MFCALQHFILYSLTSPHIPGYSWHMDRPEDAFLSQDSLTGQRNAQGE